MRKRIPPAERFWSKVDKKDAKSCWLWRGATTKDGYGFFFRSKVEGPRWYKAHRFSWELHRGEIPNGLHVLHTCDVPACVNPAHLWLGTQADNNMDRDRKGRCGAKGGHVADQRGPANGNAKLSDKDVKKIRERYSRGESQQSIADSIGCSQVQVSRIVRGEQRK